MIWLVNYIPKPIRKTVCSFKDKVISLFETNTPKQLVYEGVKKVNKLKVQKQSEENIIIALEIFLYQKRKKKLYIE